MVRRYWCGNVERK